MHEFDRLLDRDDVPGKIFVNVINQGRQRRRLARARRPSHQDEAAAQMTELFDDGRNAELLEAGDFRRDQTKDSAVAVGLLQKIAAETRAFIHLVSEIEIAALFENLPALRTAHLA